MIQGHDAERILSTLCWEPSRRDAKFTVSVYFTVFQLCLKKQQEKRKYVARPGIEPRGPGFDTRSGNILSFLLLLFQEGQLSVTGESMKYEVLVNRLGGLSLPRKSVVRLTDRPDMTLDVYRGRKTTIQQQINSAS